LAFDFAASPEFGNALARANAEIRSRQGDPPVAMIGGASVQRPAEEQEAVGENGAFARDVEEFGDAVWNRANAAKAFNDIYLAEPQGEFA
jgi:hypothetical protein